MNNILDMETIYREERSRWFKEDAPRRSFRDVVATSVPYWIVIVALVLFALSAPHTAAIFDMLTPGWGFIAPIGVEFGLLYAAFRRRLARSSAYRLPWTLLALEVLLFLTAILVNGAGSFVAVVEATDLDTLSFAAIIEGFGSIPATSQAALVMAALSAFIIPIGTLVAGDGLANLTLEQREQHDYRQIKWQEVEFTIIYRAVFVRYLQQSLPEKEARKRAMAEVKGYLSAGRSSGVRSLSAGSGQSGQALANARTTSAQLGTIKRNVQAYVDAHPEIIEQSVNQALATLREAGVAAGRTTVAEVLKERKQAVSNQEPF